MAKRDGRLKNPKHLLCYCRHMGCTWLVIVYWPKNEKYRIGNPKRVSSRRYMQLMALYSRRHKMWCEVHQPKEK